MRKLFHLSGSLFLGLSLLLGSSVASAQSKQALPPLWLTDSTLSNGYAQTVAIQQAFSRSPNMRIRVGADQNGTTRLQSVIAGKADYCVCDATGYLAQEGLLSFEDRALGPQPVRRVLSSNSPFRLNIAFAADLRTTRLSGIAGRRVAWIRNKDTINANTTALLAYAGLGWQQVSRIIFPTYAAAIEGFHNRQVDALIASTGTGSIKTLMAGKRKVSFESLNARNEEAWLRVKSIAPYLKAAIPTSRKSDAGFPWGGASHRYPVLLTSVTKSTADVYEMTKALAENFDFYADAVNGAEGWNILFQDLEGNIPFHEGTVQYFKELGIWTETAEFRQNSLIAHQTLLQRAFEQYKSRQTDDKQFREGWRATRDALFNAEIDNQVSKTDTQ